MRMRRLLPTLLLSDSRRVSRRRRRVRLLPHRLRQRELHHRAGRVHASAQRRDRRLDRHRGARPRLRAGSQQRDRRVHRRRQRRTHPPARDRAERARHPRARRRQRRARPSLRRLPERAGHRLGRARRRRAQVGAGDEPDALQVAALAYPALPRRAGAEVRQAPERPCHRLGRARQGRARAPVRRRAQCRDRGFDRRRRPQPRRLSPSTRRTARASR